MSLTYPELTHTQFPDKIDTIDNFIDITLDALPLAEEYYRRYNSGDIAGANQILIDNPNLKYSYIGASTLNPIVDAIKAMQLFYRDDVQQYLMNIVQHKGDFSATTKYTKYNTVSYLHNSALEVFMCISHDTPIGTLPTDLRYWIPLTMRGEKGESGIGLSAYGAWNPLVTYPPDAMVAYNNALWGSIVENTNIVPSETATATWYKIIEFSSDLLMFTDENTTKKYQLTIYNGMVYFQSDDNRLDVALKSDIPTSLPANGGTAETISSTLPISKGGTGATTAANALINLGITATTTELNKLHGLTPTTAELNYIKGVTGNIQTQLNGKAASSHTHTKSQITDFPSSLPANGGNSDTVDGFHFIKQTTIPTSLANNVVCFVYE